MSLAAGTAVVYDVNVYLDFVLAQNGVSQLIHAVPPTTANASADAIAVAFGAPFRLFISPHILRNTHARMQAAGQSERIADRFIEFFVDLCTHSGGSVVDPVSRDYGIGDHEDNNILALARDPAVDAMVVVSRDRHLLDLGAWNGRLMMHPREFVERVVR